MNLDEIRRRLSAALPIREPLVDPETHPRERVEKLEDYLRATAWHRGELEEALHWLAGMEVILRRRWADVVGWEPHLARRGRYTEADIHRAKRQIDPGTWDAMEEVRLLRESVGRQIRRLEIDDKATSRLYTLITGA